MRAARSSRRFRKTKKPDEEEEEPEDRRVEVGGPAEALRSELQGNGPDLRALLRDPETRRTGARGGSR